MPNWVRHHDPLLRAARELVAVGHASRDELMARDKDARARIAAAANFAIESPMPEPATVAQPRVRVSKERSMRKISYAAAIVEALRISLAEDPRVSLVGSYVLGLGPKRVLMDPIRAEFPDRIFDPPTSEAAIVSIGAGAAMAGARPFVDIGTASFSLCRLVATGQRSGGRLPHVQRHSTRAGRLPHAAWIARRRRRPAQPQSAGDVVECRRSRNRAAVQPL